MDEIKQILVPVDFSEHSAKILCSAKNIAARHGAELTVIFVLENPFTFAGIIIDHQVELQMVKACEEKIDAFLEENMRHSSIPYKGQVLRGHATIEILNCAEQQESDLIVIGTHGYSQLEKMLIGSVAGEVVRLSPCPVLTINPNKECNGMKDIKKILVPVDFSDNSVKCLESAVNFAGGCGAELLVVFVVEDLFTFSGLSIPHISFDIDLFRQEMVESSQRRLDNFIDVNLAQSSVPHKTKILKGDVTEEICEYAAEEGVDMIIMGTHGYRGLEKILIGSVAEKVVRSSPCPVLTINPYK